MCTEQRCVTLDQLQMSNSHVVNKTTSHLNIIWMTTGCCCCVFSNLFLTHLRESAFCELFTLCLAFCIDKPVVVWGTDKELSRRRHQFDAEAATYPRIVSTRAAQWWLAMRSLLRKFVLCTVLTDTLSDFRLSRGLLYSINARHFSSAGRTCKMK